MLEARRLFAAGDLDPSFGNGGRLEESVGSNPFFNDCIVLDDDKILFAGVNNLPGGGSGQTQYLLRRLNPDGTPDATFGTGGVVTGIFAPAGDSSLQELVPVAGGKVMARVTSGATVPGTSGATLVEVARFNADGSLDTTFSGDGVFAPSFLVTAFDVQSDGTTFIAGAFVTGQATTVSVARLMADGSLDTSFGDDGTATVPFGGPFGNFQTLKVQPDGRILLGGSGRVHDVDPPVFALTRLNADGSVDSGFGDNGHVLTAVPDGTPGFDFVQEIALLPDGRILAAGSVQGGLGILRYNTDGTLDASFGTGTGGTFIPFGTNAELSQLTLDEDGNALLVGSRSALGVVAARVAPDGTLDEDFGRVVAEALSSAPTALGGGLQSGGRLVVGGREDVFAAGVTTRPLFAFGLLTEDDGALSPVALDGGTGVLTVSGTADDDQIFVTARDLVLEATRNGVGRIFDVGDVSFASITGGAGDDVLVALNTDINVDIAGGDGRDKIGGGDRNDTLRGEGGRDFIDGGLGSDLIVGGGGNDQLRGQGGADRLYGRDGNDGIEGNGGNDRIDGGSGTDILRGGIGNDHFAADDGAGDQLFGNLGLDSAVADAEDELTGIEST